ncbi:Ubiquitin carboxyl-terminal hydrolase 10 [Malassezia brasiliensis]|uniref:Ubiquitin carboxyl-terminal hydrolase 10 n=1 Tax=Malassezia brasiliensis TaxID=1821822 RepID=A0AAF0IMH4_9BASI|nr:Ubiquitin carboxyl-terminal hydrolase 10 [Malassezia brasiliensis]
MSEVESTDAGRAAKRARTLKENNEGEEKAIERQRAEKDEDDYYDVTVADVEAEKVPVRHDLYLDTIDRNQLDFDFEKVCSVSLSNVNIYACLVCGKYYQGRGKRTHAYFHSIDEEHHVFMNLSTGQVYVLPDNYEVQDKSLSDIQYQLSLTFSERDIRQLDAPNAPTPRTLDAKAYLPGFVGLNNIGANDSMNVVIQALVHVPPLRNYFLRGGTPKAQRSNVQAANGPVSQAEAAGALVQSTELVQRFATLVRRIWNPHSFKAQVSPHEFLQEVSRASNGRFKLTEQADPVEFLGWLLNRLHFDLAGSASAGRKRPTIITQCFQGEVRVESQKVIVRTGLEDDEVTDSLDHDGRRSGGQQDEHGHAKFNIDQAITVNTTPFLLLAIDLPPPPVFQDTAKENIIPQTPISQVLAKYDGVTFQESNGTIRRYHLTKLPPYLILHYRRFTKNRFIEERNPTIVNFPIMGLDMRDYVQPPAPGEPTIGTLYSLLSNITHEATPGTVRENSVWRSQVHTRSDGATKTTEPAPEDRWFQMQDLIMDEVNKQMLFLGESYIQIWERKDAVHEVEAQANRLVVPRSHSTTKNV